MSYTRIWRLAYLNQASSRAAALDFGLFRVGREVRYLDYRHLKKFFVCHFGGGALDDWPEASRERFEGNGRALPWQT